MSFRRAAVCAAGRRRLDLRPLTPAQRCTPIGTWRTRLSETPTFGTAVSPQRRSAWARRRPAAPLGRRASMPQVGYEWDHVCARDTSSALMWASRCLGLLPWVLNACLRVQGQVGHGSELLHITVPSKTRCRGGMRELWRGSACK